MSIVLDLQKNKGIILDLSKAAPSLAHLRLEVSWDMNPNTSVNEDDFDMDLSVFALNNQGKIESADDVVYFKHQVFGPNAVVLPEDVRGGGSTEVVDFDLSKVPTSRNQLDAYVTLFEADKRGQSFGAITNAKVTLRDKDTDKVLQEYSVNDSFAPFSVLHIGSLGRENGNWVFAPAGVGISGDLNTIAALYQ
jgi:tellurium resistance protein TerD